MNQTIEQINKATTIKAFDAAFNQRDKNAFETYWSPNYIQHSSHIPAGREGLQNLVENLPASLKYESIEIMAEGHYVMVHGRFSGIDGPAWIVVDIIRFENGLLAEHWDVIQDEATKESSASGRPMFGNSFGPSL